MLDTGALKSFKRRNDDAGSDNIIINSMMEEGECRARKYPNIFPTVHLSSRRLGPWVLHVLPLAATDDGLQV